MSQGIGLHSVFRTMSNVGLLAGLMVTLGVPGWALEARPFDLHEPTTIGSVQNLPDWGQRLLVESDYPGYERWKLWPIQTKDPQTGAIVTCRRRNYNECHQFATAEAYQQFRLNQYLAKDQRTYRSAPNAYRNRVSQSPAYPNRVSSAATSPRLWSPPEQVIPYVAPAAPQGIAPQAMVPAESYSPAPAAGHNRVNGGNQWSNPLQ